MYPEITTRKDDPSEWAPTTFICECGYETIDCGAFMDHLVNEHPDKWLEMMKAQSASRSPDEYVGELKVNSVDGTDDGFFTHSEIDNITNGWGWSVNGICSNCGFDKCFMLCGPSRPQLICACCHVKFGREEFRR